MSLDINIKKKSDKIVINVKGELFEDVQEPIYVSFSLYYFKNIQKFVHIQSKSPKAH